MHFFLLLFLFPLSCAGAPVQQVRYLDLKKLIETRNERVKARESEHKAAELRSGSLTRSFLPRIELFGAQESFKIGQRGFLTQPTYGAEATLNLFNAGRDQFESSRLTLASRRKVFERQLTLTEELARARQQYWKILYLRDSLSLLREAQALNEDIRASAERRIKSGVATESDRIEFEMKAVELQQDLEGTQIELRNEKALLAAVLGTDEQTELELTEQLDHEHEWEKVLTHETKDHEFLLMPKELAIQESSLASSSKARSYWPRLDAYAGWRQHNQREEDQPFRRDRTETLFGLKLSMSLFDGFTSQREASALNAEAEAAEFELGFLKRDIEAHIHNELADLKLRHGQVHAAESNTKRATRYYALTKSEYNRGVKNSPDVLGAAEKLFSTKQRHLAIIRDFQISKAHVLSKMGR